MPLEDYLDEDEEVIAKFSQHGIHFYATNKKIIRHRGGSQEEVNMLFYPHIASISVVFHNWIIWILLGAIIFISSFFWGYFLEIFGINDNELFTIITVITIFISISFIAQGIYNYNRCSLTFVVSGFSTTDKMKWNIQRAKLGELKKFVIAVEKEIGKLMEKE
ncbi:hypothetical protein B6U81_01700 [Thermoplasmatales archaeon ex4484_30]|nr:MAG: hypothetical protein B6U81_01700 [Thermoplasmatales archaeon ex4484_30]